MRDTARDSERGVTLLELMIAMAILAIGLLAMWRLHLVGLTSNSAARRYTNAVAVAEELAAGLERLGPGDPLVSAPAATPDPPSDFGPVLQPDGSLLTAARIHVWDDANPVPGVRLNAQLRERTEPGTSLERRWSVWTVQTTSTAGAVTNSARLIAVSVTWFDPPFGRAREVLLYTSIGNPGVLRQSAAASDQNAWDLASPNAVGGGGS